MDSGAGLQGTYQNGAAVDPFRITREQFLADRYGETHGTANPSIMDKPFWKYMVARGGDAYSARKLFDKEEDFYNNLDDQTVWCFSRFGSTTTQLPDGRHVHIAGEHEDFYDPDFCIYNDVVVIEAPQPLNSATLFTPDDEIVDDNWRPEFPSSPPEDDDGDDMVDYCRRPKFPQPTSPESITIYGYPVDVFPPTDFHTATFFRDPMSGKECIFIIGGLGYIGSASRDRTDVYRLDLSDFSIQLLETSGAKPDGGTDGHKAELVDDGDGTDAAIKITTKDGTAFSLLIDRLEWISHG